MTILCEVCGDAAHVRTVSSVTFVNDFKPRSGSLMATYANAENTLTLCLDCLAWGQNVAHEEATEAVRFELDKQKEDAN